MTTVKERSLPNTNTGPRTPIGLKHFDYLLKC